MNEIAVIAAKLIEPIKLKGSDKVITDTFFSIVRLAMQRMQRTQQDETIGTEENPVIFGNVEFWVSHEGEWVYSKPTNAWDTAAITNDLSVWF